MNRLHAIENLVLARAVVAKTSARALCLFVLLLPLSTAAREPSTPGAERPRIQFRAEEDRSEVTWTGLSSETLRRFLSLDDAGKGRIFPVYTGSGDTPLLGTYSASGDLVVFTPRFPFTRGIEYTAAYLPSDTSWEGRETNTTFTLAHTSSSRARVAHIYPSPDALPENLLKFYIHFTEPMNRGSAYDHIRLYRADGTEVEAPFPEFGDELWDGRQMRLTVFLDPGRIKRGIALREAIGPPLVAGNTYTLVIEKEWKAATGRPLDAAYEKTFRTLPADYKSPDVNKWRVETPQGGTTEALRIGFPEPMDHALMERVIVVEDSRGVEVEGVGAAAPGEAAWSFTPASAWVRGDYTIRAAGTLEDVAGNSLSQPFEVDLTKRRGGVAPPADRTISITIR